MTTFVLVMSKEQILVRITGKDRIGLTASIMTILAKYDAEVLDIGQADIHSTLSLGILFRIDETYSGQVMKELLFKTTELGVQIAHIAIGLGVKACLEGYSVFFTSVPRLLTLIREAKTEKTLRNLELRFERFDLVICDELGYVGFDKEGAEMLFNHLSLRTGKKATIITANLPFTRWEEVLKDKVLCSALVDRLCHKSYLVNMTGASYRVKETKKIINKYNV